MCELTIPFSASGDYQHRMRSETPCLDCKAARNEAARYRRQVNGNENTRWNKLWHRYRIRADDYLEMLVAQDNKCLLCLNSFKNTAEMHMDHDHNCDHPGKGERSCRECIRGILCRNCNVRLIGVEDAVWLRRALRYIGEEMI